MYPNLLFTATSKQALVDRLLSTPLNIKITTPYNTLLILVQPFIMSIKFYLSLMLKLDLLLAIFISHKC